MTHILTHSLPTTFFHEKRRLAQSWLLCDVVRTDFPFFRIRSVGNVEVEATITIEMVVVTTETTMIAVWMIVGVMIGEGTIAGVTIDEGTIAGTIGAMIMTTSTIDLVVNGEIEVVTAVDMASPAGAGTRL